MSNFVDLPIAKAINAGIKKAMQENPKVLMFGEDVAELGGVFRVTEGLHAEFGGVGRDTKVRALGQLHAARDRMAVDRRDHGLALQFQLAQHLLHRHRGDRKRVV